jgi:glycosyltransferase involved in cell wall biosynthesis
MRVLFLNSSRKGGAYIATKRIMKSVEETGVFCEFLSQNDKLINNKPRKLKGLQLFKINLVKLLNLLLQKLFTKDSYLSFGLIGTLDVNKINQSNFDIIHLNWINNGFVSIYQISKINKPIVWTVHDMWLVSGIKHTKDLRESESLGIIHNIFQNHKKKILNRKKIIFVSPSLWLLKKLENNFKLRNIHIPNPIDNNIFKHSDINFVSENNFRILFMHYNLTDPHKGFSLLNDALNKISYKYNIELVTIAKQGQFNIKYKFLSIPFLHSEKELVELYNSVDLIAVPSKIDNYPNVALEAIFCGKPVIGFDLGGLSEIVYHKKNGYLAKPFDIDDLADGVEFLIKNNLDIKYCYKNTMQNVGKSYIEVYASIVKN